MTEQKQNYRIKGKTYSEQDLKVFSKGKLKNQATPAWEKDIHRFILDWLSALELIQVQTSGSTGIPKTVEFQKTHVEASAQATIAYLDLKPRGVAFLCLPAQYIAGKMMIVRALIGGLDLHYTEPASNPDFGGLKEIELAGLIPMQVTRLLETPQGVRKLNTVRKLIIGGSFVPAILEEKLKLLPNPIWATYGMTETITHIALRRLNGSEASEWYTPLPMVKVNLDDRGCAVVNAPHIGLDDLVTNDLAQVNGEGRFKVLGRIDNVVMSGGLLLHPEILEKKLHAFIANDFFMAGLHDYELGERLVLFIEDPGKELENKEEELWAVIKERLSGYEVPKSIILMEKFTRTGNGKTLRPNTVDDYVSEMKERMEND